jgi:hypothetical protein
VLLPWGSEVSPTGNKFNRQVSLCKSEQKQLGNAANALLRVSIPSHISLTNTPLRGGRMVALVERARLGSVHVTRARQKNMP